MTDLKNRESNELAKRFIDDTHELEDIGLSVVSRMNPHEVSALCPFHGESNASFYLNRDSGRYFCHGCGARGGLAGLVSKLTGDPEDVCSYGIFRAFIPRVTRRVPRDSRFFRDTLYKISYSEKSNADIVVSSRAGHVSGVRDGLLDASETMFGLSMCSISISGAAGVDAIEIPANMSVTHSIDIDRGLTQYRIVHPTDRIKKYYNVMNKNTALFNMRGLMKQRNIGAPVIITEGAFDAIRIMEAIGYEAPVVSCYSSSISDEQLSMILAVSKRMIVCFDNDQAGENGVDALKKKVSGVECIDVLMARSNSHDFGCEDRDSIRRIFKTLI